MKTDPLGRIRAALPICALAVLAPVQAHHSNAAEFDPNKPVTFTGTVQKVMWMNPHIYTWIEVAQQDAPSIVYHVEGGAPNALFRQGWRQISLKAGDVVTVNGSRAKNPDSANVGLATITAADGHRVFSGDGPAKAGGS